MILCRWVEDADLWRWALVPQSRAFSAGLAVLKTDFHVGRNPEVWQQLQQLDIQDVLAKVCVLGPVRGGGGAVGE
jgi:hypothetical protein